MQVLSCSFCNRECKNHNSWRNHERLCKLNPNKQTTYFSDPAFKEYKKTNKHAITYRNQFTKAKAEGKEFIVSEETIQKIKKSRNLRSDELNKSIGKKVSKTLLEKSAKGEWHTSLARKMHHTYKGVDLHGTWELKYAQYLDSKNILWERCKESFKYLFEGKWRYYTPDFYLPETDEYIEIKGYKTEKDDAKWVQFPKYRKLKVLMERELKELNIL